MTRSSLPSFLALLVLAMPASGADSPPVAVKVRPDTVYVERTGERQFLSFDELRTTADLFDADALPAVFQGFRRIGSPAGESGRIAPGWVVITEPVRPAEPH